jgi:hypothetical protein
MSLQHLEIYYFLLLLLCFYVTTSQFFASLIDTEKSNTFFGGERNTQTHTHTLARKVKEMSITPNFIYLPFSMLNALIY